MKARPMLTPLQDKMLEQERHRRYKAWLEQFSIDVDSCWLRALQKRYHYKAETLESIWNDAMDGITELSKQYDEKNSEAGVIARRELKHNTGLDVEEMYRKRKAKQR